MSIKDSSFLLITNYILQTGSYFVYFEFVDVLLVLLFAKIEISDRLILSEFVEIFTCGLRTERFSDADANANTFSPSFLTDRSSLMSSLFAELFGFKASIT